MFIFRGSFRTFRCSCSHRVLTYRVPKHRAHTCCSHIEVFLWLCGGIFVLVFLWWCSCSGVVVFLWWCFCVGGVVVFLWWCGGVFVVVVWWCFCGGVVARELVLFFAVSTSGPRTRTCRCFARLWWCFWCFCGAVFGVFVVVVSWYQHPARELVLFGVLQDHTYRAHI